MKFFLPVLLVVALGCNSNSGTDSSGEGTVSIASDVRGLLVGEEVQLSSEFDNGSGAQPVTNAEWTSSNPSVATVNDQGFVQGVARGSAAITATVDGIDSAPYPIAVLDMEVMGDFRIPDGSTKMVMGDVTVQELNGSQLEVAFSGDFSVTDGPDLYVFLANSDFPGEGSLNLGRFKSPEGAQTYPVPLDVKLTDYNHVVIYCVPFSVVFAYARTW